MPTSVDRSAFGYKHPSSSKRYPDGGDGESKLRKGCGQEFKKQLKGGFKYLLFENSFLHMLASADSIDSQSSLLRRLIDCFESATLKHQFGTLSLTNRN
jgi:hypothetical protein